MSLVDKLLMPKKLVMAGWIMISALFIAIIIEYLGLFDTTRCVKTVFIYLLLDYCWATFKREHLSDRF